MDHNLFDWCWLYTILCALRVLSVFYSPGYIHPDEWFQSTEAIAGDLLQLETVRTWEFDPTFPCRSMASIFAANGPMLLLMWLSKRVGISVIALRLLYVQRITQVVISFFLDFVLVKLMGSPVEAPRIQCRSKFTKYTSLSLYASSSAALAFMPRAFSNSVEAFYFALTLLTTQRIMIKVSQKNQPLNSSFALLGAAFAMGSFTRFTFPIFAAPSLFLSAWTLWSSQPKKSRLLAPVTAAAASAALIALLHIAVDTLYYGATHDISTGAFGSIVIAPLNALLYNLRSDNLAEHGLHPRWLHFAVNAPMLLGVPAFAATLISLGSVLTLPDIASSSGSAKRRENAFSAATNWLLVSSIVFPLALLSVQPHQEPRFLLPLVLPSIAVLSRALQSARFEASKGILGRWWSLAIGAQIAQGLLLSVFFGILHQGGLIPCLVQLNADLLRNAGIDHHAPVAWLPGAASTSQPPRVELLFWRTFMPPRHLLLPPPSAAIVSVRDLGSLAPCGVRSLLRDDAGGGLNTDTTRLLIAPQWALQTLEHHGAPEAPLPPRGDAVVPKTSFKLSHVYNFGPNLDTDHLGETVALWREGRMGVGDALALVVSIVDRVEVPSSRQQEAK